MLIKHSKFYREIENEGGTGGGGDPTTQEQDNTNQQDTGGEQLEGIDAVIAATETPAQREAAKAATTGGSQGQSPQQGGPQGAQQGRQPQQGAGNPGAAQQPVQRAAPNGRYSVNQQGNLVDPVTGALLARQGPERRFYEEARFAERKLNAAERELDKLTTQLNTYKEASTLGNTLQLDSNDQIMAMQLMSNYKKDPIGTLKFMLTEAQAAGHNLGSILPGGPQGAFDPTVIARMLDERLKPLTERNEQERRIQEAGEQGASEAEQFFTSFPDAKIHEAAIVQLMMRDESLTPREAYLSMKTWALEKGLDWSKPLHSQFDANGGVVRPQQGERQLPMLSHGAPVTGRGAPQHQQSRNPAVFDSTDSKDIVRAAMREAGLMVS